jgi:alkanesulfonate monooxygenase SsuD/methylene tetrahydromethanopterin reductase-like flavin-dependent oxidoreductase (luciferase family)
VAQRIRIGLYCDMRNPDAARPWTELYAATLDRIVAAEERGLEAVWTTEHHGFADGYLPQPLLMCAAIAARTRTVRIGTAVTLAPLVHPQHLAEQAAIVDILSGGRLELGLGAGWRAQEFEAFGADLATRYEALATAATALEALWESGAATPPPVQRPLPTWLGVRGPRGARIAGRSGAGLLWIDGELMAPYLEGLAEGGHEPAAARVAGLVNVYLADDPEDALERVRRGARQRRDSYRGAEAKGRAAAAPRLEVLTPADAAKRIAELTRGLPVTDVFCFDRVGADAELSDRHVELLTDALPDLLAAELAAAGA